MAIVFYKDLADAKKAAAAVNKALRSFECYFQKVGRVWKVEAPRVSYFNFESILYLADINHPVDNNELAAPPATVLKYGARRVVY